MYMNPTIWLSFFPFQFSILDKFQLVFRKSASERTTQTGCQPVSQSSIQLTSLTYTSVFALQWSLIMDQRLFAIAGFSFHVYCLTGVTNFCGHSLFPCFYINCLSYMFICIYLFHGHITSSPIHCSLSRNLCGHRLYFSTFFAPALCFYLFPWFNELLRVYKLSSCCKLKHYFLHQQQTAHCLDKCILGT